MDSIDAVDYKPPYHAGRSIRKLPTADRGQGTLTC